MKKVQLVVTIEGGTGSVFINVNDANIYHLQGAGNHEAEIDLSPDEYAAVISGSEPSDGSISIAFNQDTQLLASAKFTQTVFYGIMPFTVK